MKNEKDRTNISAAWKQAAKLLSVRIETPFSLEVKDGTLIPCVAYLPDFGSANGMVFDVTCGPKYEINNALKVAAESKEMFYSFVNSKVYEKYEEGVFKEALIDWGFFGENSERPSWLARKTS